MPPKEVKSSKMKVCCDQKYFILILIQWNILLTWLKMSKDYKEHYLKEESHVACLAFSLLRIYKILYNFRKVFLVVL